ncbi:MAG: cytochrome c maturation protein CcmE, partial [Chloroflexota bacterium]
MARGKFIIGGLVILAAIVYLIVSSTQATAQYFLTVNEMNEKTKSITGQNVRISGAVIGDTIDYDPQTLKLSFTIANIPGDNQEIESQGGLAKVLHEAATNSKLARLKVVYNGPKPDLLRDE